MDNNDISKAIDDLFDDGELNNSIDNNFSNFEITNESNNEEEKEIDVLNLNDNTDKNINTIVDENNNFNIASENIVEEIKEQEPIENINYDYVQKNNSENDKDKSKFKILLYFLIGFVIGTVILIIVNGITSQENKKMVCKYEVLKEEYDLIDEYVIEYNKNNIKYITGKYSYNAKIESFNKEINRIRDEKLDVIINGNGIDGIVHNFEISENSILIESYYDFDKLDFKSINNIDYKANPISYIKLNSNLKLKDLKKELEKKQYKCINSK